MSNFPREQRPRSDVDLARDLPRALFNISPKLNYPLSRVRQVGCLLGGHGLMGMDSGCKAETTISEAKRHPDDGWMEGWMSGAFYVVLLCDF